jgi:hypothetical protein
MHITATPHMHGSVGPVSLFAIIMPTAPRLSMTANPKIIGNSKFIFLNNKSLNKSKLHSNSQILIMGFPLYQIWLYHYNLVGSLTCNVELNHTKKTLFHIASPALLTPYLVFNVLYYVYHRSID